MFIFGGRNIFPDTLWKGKLSARNQSQKSGTDLRHQFWHIRHKGSHGPRQTLINSVKQDGYSKNKSSNSSNRSRLCTVRSMLLPR